LKVRCQACGWKVGCQACGWKVGCQACGWKVGCQACGWKVGCQACGWKVGCQVARLENALSGRTFGWLGSDRGRGLRCQVVVGVALLRRAVGLHGLLERLGLRGRGCVVRGAPPDRAVWVTPWLPDSGVLIVFFRNA
jgi:hypothetical protein